MKFIKQVAFASVFALASGAVLAETLTFDSFTGSINNRNYGGFSWNNFSVINAASSNSGYHNAMISGTNVAYNSFANPATFGNATAFTLNSAYFIGAWNDGLSIHVVGTGPGTTTYTRDFVVNSTTASNIVFNWSGLTSVRISSSGGTPHAGYSGAGAHFGMDNLTVNAAPVPEPETYAMMLAGLGLLGFMARRKKAVKLA